MASPTNPTTLSLPYKAPSPQVDRIIESVIGIEGGYSNDPNDAGGATRWGVTQRVARSFGYYGPMKDLPRDTAKAILLAGYFLKPGFDRVHTLSPAVAAELFEVEVNLPPGKAVGFLLRALNALNNQGKQYADLPVTTGVSQPLLTALNTYLARRGPAGELVLLQILNAQQAVYYLERAEAKPQNESFLYGWLKNRTQAE